MSSKESLSILEVIENLNTLVEADSLEDIEVTEYGAFISHKEEEDEEVYWTKAGPNEETMIAIRETFRSVHKYLLSFYRKMKQSGDQKKLIDGVNTIMVLVGEAEKKLEKFDHLFKEKIPKLNEYKSLQNFYRNHVIKESFKEFSRPLLPKTAEPEEAVWEKEFEELLTEAPIEEVEGVHLLNDIGIVKNDHLYELFFIRNEAGSHFYTQELARNIKLACDFGEFSSHYFGEDPLLQIKNWEDRSIHVLAKKILSACQEPIQKFYKEAFRYREIEIVSSLQKALLALMLAANLRTLIRQFSPKGSYLYFRDFQLFLRDALNNREYQRFLIYSPPSSTPFFTDCLALIHGLVYHTFTLGPDLSEVQNALTEMTKEVYAKKPKKLSSFLQDSNESINTILSKHPNGPVFKALDLVREEEERKFDPYMQSNLPGVEALLKGGKKEIKVMRFPCPIIQEYIDHAVVSEDFKAFLHASVLVEDFHFLFFNFQDRTSWKEHARCSALEELASLAEFSPLLTVVTLTRDADFYHQQGIYHDLGDAEQFMTHFLEHLQDESTGYYFPQALKKELFPTFGKRLFKTIHETFFNGEKELKLRSRLDFIEIAYSFLVLKIIELVPATLMTLSSKDGLDIGGTATCELLALLALGQNKAFQNKKWSEEELENLNRMVFGPTLLHRERGVHQERLERLHGMIQSLEEKNGFLVNFEPLFNKATLQLEPQFYKESATQ